MNRIGHYAMLALVSGATVGAAVPARAGECTVEDWRSRHDTSINVLWIEGATTCAEGRIRIHVYDNSGGSPAFVGVADGYVEGFIFEAFVSDVSKKPESIEIKYSIEIQ